MPQRGKYKKARNQPSVAPMLNATMSAKSVSSAISCDSLRSASNPQETNGLVSKKRRRETRDSVGNSPQDGSRTLKKEKKAKTMENNTVVEKVHESTEITLSEEMQQLEKRITDNITNHNQDTMKNLIQETMKEMLKPIQDSIDNLLVLKTNMESQEGRITQLKYENSKLNNELNQIKTEMGYFQRKINQLEDRSLEKNLIFQGISESIPDDEEAQTEKIYRTISDTISRETPEERLQLAREVEIIRTRRLGKPDPSRTRAISVELLNKYDVEQIYANRFSMEEGVFVDKEFCQATEKDRRLLRPILKAAKNLPEYKKKCRLEGNQLVLDGKRYNKENLHQLPKKLDPMKVATKSTEDSLGFFGELCPLSNFHRSPFLYNEVNYHSSEQMIQHMKAKVFGDKVVQKQILDAKTPLECKHLSKDISNFSFKTWAKKAKDVCKKGLEAKFMQNPRAMQSLLETGHKKLVECMYDTLWGNGIPLHQPMCLNQHLWKNQGILGKLLQEIRQKHLDLAKVLLPSLNPWFHQGSPNTSNTPNFNQNTVAVTMSKPMDKSYHPASPSIAVANSTNSFTTPVDMQVTESGSTELETRNSKL